jgi:hypothetical protein
MTRSRSVAQVLPAAAPVKGFKFSADPQLEAKVRDVVGLYLAPPENAVVVCVDELGRTGALERDIRDWIGTWNENPRPFAWTKQLRRSSTPWPKW